MSLRVLLVEDEPDIRLIARAALTRGGFEVAIAEDGDAALAAVAATPPDVVLLDWMLPTIDGFETCVRLKADAATRDIPVIFFTAKSKDGDRERCLALGAIGCIQKPFDPRALADQVRTALIDADGRAGPPCA